MRRLQLYIQGNQEGRKVETLLRRELHLSAGAVRRAKALPDGILLDGAAVRTTAFAREGQLLSVAVGDRAGSRQILPSPGPLVIPYEDEDLLVIDKPGGVPVHPGPGHYGDTMANFLMAYYQEKNLTAAFHPVNRLDSGTSGLMVIAKHSHAHERLQDQGKNGGLRRVYWAVCEGVPVPRRGCIDLPIARAPGAVLKRQVDRTGARAVTHYEVLKTGCGRSLVRLWLETGRTHQIRVHMADLGCPLAGDFLYGEELPELPGRFALHGGELTFRQPVTGEAISLTSPLPAPLAALLSNQTGGDVP